MIVREAAAEAERLVDRARREIERLEASAQNLARQHHAYLAALRSLVERQKAELDALADAQPSPFGKVAGTIAPAAPPRPTARARAASRRRSGSSRSSRSERRSGAPRRRRGPRPRRARARDRDHPRDGARRARRATSRSRPRSPTATFPASRSRRWSRTRAGCCAARWAGGRRRDGRPVPPLRGLRPPADRLPGAGPARARREGPDRLQRLRRDAPAVVARRPGAAHRPHQSAGRQPAGGPERRPGRGRGSRTCPSRTIPSLRHLARDVALERRHHAARGRVRRGDRAQSRDPRGVPDAAVHGRRRGRHEHGARGHRRRALRDAGARHLDHHRPVSPGRAGAAPTSSASSASRRRRSRGSRP